MVQASTVLKLIICMNNLAGNMARNQIWHSKRQAPTEKTVDA